jgi:hypothetical protein
MSAADQKLSLTPLRFPRISNGALNYHTHMYITHCLRFQIAIYGSRDESGRFCRSWIIKPNIWDSLLDNYFDPSKVLRYESWLSWLNDVGLAEAVFSRRKDAVKALNQMLLTEKLTDSWVCPGFQGQVYA